jgi:hypothetical protein
MSKLQIGQLTDGAPVRVDLDRFLVTRGLLTANSGGGKSYSLRRFIEVTAGKIQQVVIDTEGEFATLREKFDFVIAAAAGGDAIAHPKTAALLARRLLETGVSAIIDISELKSDQRHEFVRAFIADGLMETPRALWTSLLVILDEAHLYCPEKGQGESVATDAVMDLSTRGRKRGFCLMAATQRISKFNKSAAAELLNRFTGRMGLDVDVKRAAFDLGITPKEAQGLLPSLLEGQFYVFGPAISKTVELMRFDSVETTHPTPGQRKKGIAVPKPTDAIRAVLPQLADLQIEQEQKAKTEEDLRRELAQVKRDLAVTQRAQPKPAALAPGPDRRTAAQIQKLTALIEELMKFVVTVSATDFAAKAGETVDANALQAAIVAAVTKAKGLIEAGLAKRDGELQAVRRDAARLVTRAQKLLADQEVHIAVEVKHNEPFTVAPVPRATKPERRRVLSTNSQESSDLPRGEAAVLTACIQYPEGLRREQLTVLTGYKRSSRDAYIQRLREKGFVHTTGDRVQATQTGIDALPHAEPLPTGEALQEFWLQRLPEGEKKILQVLIEAHPEAVARAEIDDRTGYKRSSRDAYLQRLSAKELVAMNRGGDVAASEQLFA